MHFLFKLEILKYQVYIRLHFLICGCGKKKAHGQLVGASPYVRMRREIVSTAIAPCSNSVRKIQSLHTYKSQDSK